VAENQWAMVSVFSALAAINRQLCAIPFPFRSGAEARSLANRLGDAGWKC